METAILLVEGESEDRDDPKDVLMTNLIHGLNKQILFKEKINNLIFPDLSL